jgi:hypothetical protein
MHTHIAPTNLLLYTHIHRCLKKVQEGIDEFDQIWQKVGWAGSKQCRGNA